MSHGLASLEGFHFLAVVQLHLQKLLLLVSPSWAGGPSTGEVSIAATVGGLVRIRRRRTVETGWSTAGVRQVFFDLKWALAGSRAGCVDGEPTQTQPLVRAAAVDVVGLSAVVAQRTIIWRSPHLGLPGRLVSGYRGSGGRH